MIKDIKFVSYTTEMKFFYQKERIQELRVTVFHHYYQV